MRPHVPRPHVEPSPADTRLHAYDQPHGRQDTIAWVALGLGVASFLLAAVGGSILGVVVGVVGLATAVFAQMVSATTAERWLILPGWVMSALGIALNLFWI